MNELTSILEARIRSASPQRHSGVVCVIDGFLPLREYADLDSAFPTAGELIPGVHNGEPERFNGRYSHRLEMTLPRDLSNLDPSRRSPWASLTDVLGSREILRATCTKLDLDRGDDSLDDYVDRLEVRLRVCRHVGDYHLGPHTDHGKKVASMLLYFAEGDSQRSLGTSFYNHRDPNFTSLGDEHLPFDDFVEVLRVDFLPNRALLFGRTDQSFHGVAPFVGKASETERRLVQVEIWQRDPRPKASQKKTSRQLRRLFR